MSEDRRLVVYTEGKGLVRIKVDAPGERAVSIMVRTDDLADALLLAEEATTPSSFRVDQYKSDV